MHEMPELTREIRCAYAAGLFDGEGHIAISYRTRGTRIVFGYRLDIANVNRTMLQRIQEWFGGNITLNKRNRVYYLLLAGDTADAFLVSIRPYLIAKADEADIAIEFRRTAISKYARDKVGRVPELSGNVIAIRKKLVDKIKSVRNDKKSGQLHLSLRSSR